MTTEKTYGKWIRSNPESFSLGDTVTFKSEFMKSELTKMVFAEVCEVAFDFEGTVNSGAGTDAFGYDACKLVEKVRLSDDIPFVDVSGEGARLNAIIELGNRYRDMTTLAAGAADATRKWRLPIPYELVKARRPRDFTFPLWHLAEGTSELTFAPALPTGWDGFTSGKVRMKLRIRDGRREEAHSRLVLREQAVTIQESTYHVNGSLRHASLFTKLATTGMSSLAAYTTFDSVALGYLPSHEVETLVEHYLRQTDGVFASDPFLASTITAIPLVAPCHRQKIGAMMDLGEFMLDIKAAPPSYMRLLTSVVMDRIPSQAARDIGQPSPAEYQQAAVERGEVPNPNGTNKQWKGFPNNLRRRLPVRAKGVAKAAD